MGTKAIEFVSTRDSMYLFSATITDPSGKKREESSAAMRSSGIRRLSRVKLAPGQTIASPSGPLTFLPDNQAYEHHAGVSVDTRPGLHTIQLSVHFPAGSANSGRAEPQPGDWTGTLTTGKVELEVVEGDSSATPVAPL